METQAAGKEAVGDHVLEHIGLVAARGIDRPGHKTCPAAKIFSIEVNRRGCAGSPAACMEPDHFVPRDAEEAVGEAVPEIVLGGKGNFSDIRKAFDGIGINDPRLAEPFFIEGSTQGLAYRCFKLCKLKGLQFRPGEGFHFLIPVLVGHERLLESIL
ncbi:hypothetical protein AGMMS49579_14340 [Spirochaetia bacterium]|nr:hypothetical protein AGMMS49579_14340 [Spirochaetia bacterium]